MWAVWKDAGGNERASSRMSGTEGETGGLGLGARSVEDQTIVSSGEGLNTLASRGGPREFGHEGI